jgi:16S rRNA (adenine1518-N6/adenine1519-N6)-dimethyltransferase
MVRGAPAVTGTGRDPFAHYRAELDALGFKPSSARGQNFLLDPSLHRAIADAAAPAPGDAVLEIGTGLGFLTRELAPRCRCVLGVEIDDRLLAIARRELRAFANVQLLHADALGGPGRTLHPAVVAALDGAVGDGDYQVIANLPYSISGPLLAELSCLERLPQRAVVLVQKELGGRIAAAADSAEYGSLSVLVQSAFAARVLRTVPPEVFRPRPKVVSSLLLLARRPELPLAPAERRPFARFVRALFQQRRKTLRLALPRAAAAAGAPIPVVPSLQPPGLPPALLQRRAEALSVAEVIDLWRRTGRMPPPGPTPDSRPR